MTRRHRTAKNPTGAPATRQRRGLTDGRRFVAGLGAICLVAAAGCGGDDDDTGVEPVDTTAAPTEATEPTEPTDAPATTAATPDTTAADQAETVEVLMVNISFDPEEITVPVGSTVVWTNEDTVDHTTTSEDDVWDSGVIPPGESFEFTFDEPGTYSYLCTIHPTQMQGTVVVEG